MILLLACTGAPVETVPLGPPTDTFPSFYGEVPRNLLMVSMDTLRRDRMARYGGTGLLPFLDDKAATGVPLERHRSCSNWTMPSVLCVNYGTTNIDLGFAPDLHSPDDALDPGGEPLAARLTDAGWSTRLVTSNSWFSADHGTDVGFEASVRPDNRSTNGVFEVGLEQIQEIEAAGEAPWYVHLHVKEPHPAYDPPESYLAGLEALPPIPWDLTISDEQYASIRDWSGLTEEERALLLQHLLVRYDGEVAWMNDELDAQFARLDEAGALDDTLVVFWTDHGEEFWEHGEQTHAYGLHGEVNDSIGILWAKNIVPGVWEEPTSHIDLAPTVLDLFGQPLPAEMTGLPIGTAPPDRALDAVAVARLGVIQSVVKDGWKLVYTWSTGERRLYDTVNDPLELDDVYAADDARAVELEALLAPRIAAMQPLAPGYVPR